MDEQREEEAEEKQPWFTPLRIIGALFLILIVVLVNIPLSGIKLDPEPVYIAGAEIIPKDIEYDNATIRVVSRTDFLRLIMPTDTIVKYVADKAAVSGCTSNKVCQAKAIYYFVRDNFEYVSDPNSYEYVKSARESLATRAGDCDDAAVLLANLEEAIGIPTRFVFIPGHVYIQIYLPETLSKYKEKNIDWVSLDATCKSCGFGELPYKDRISKKVIVER